MEQNPTILLTQVELKKRIFEDAALLGICVRTRGSFNGTRAHTVPQSETRVKGPWTKHSLVHASAYKSLVGQP